MAISEISPHVRNVGMGIISHLRGRPAPSEAYQSMIHLHGLTQGRSTNFLSSLLSVHRSYRPRPVTSPIFGSVADDSISSIVAEVEERGFSVLPMKLPPEMIGRLVKFARTNPAIFQGGDRAGCDVFDEHAPQARLYKFSASDCARSEDVQMVLADSFFFEIAARYLGVTPIVDVLTMWWSAVFDSGDVSEAAQLFHFDMDRPRWLKLFVYLTDVDDTAGPHVYVEKSHRKRGEKVGNLLSRGYTRISDADVIDTYGESALQSIGGEAGTIFVADTMGFHKGLPPTGRARLVLQLSYATTLFGSEWGPATMPASVIKELDSARAAHPVTYTLFR